VFDYNFIILAQFRWEGQKPLSAGKHTIVFDFKYDGPGIAKGGAGVLTVDGREVASHKIPHTIAFLMVGDETFDVGVDTRTPVNDKDYQVPFSFTGKINKLTFSLGPMQLTAEDQRKMHRWGALNDLENGSFGRIGRKGRNSTSLLYGWRRGR
jgi:hypothetical protein